MDDFIACTKSASMKRGRAEAIVGEVRDTVSRWNEYADQAGVSPLIRDQIRRSLRLSDLS